MIDSPHISGIIHMCRDPFSEGNHSCQNPLADLLHGHEDFHAFSRASGPSCNQLRNSSHTLRHPPSLAIDRERATARWLADAMRSRRSA